MTNYEFQRFGIDLLTELQQATIWTQVFVIVAALVLGWMLARFLRTRLRARQEGARAPIAVGWGSVNRAIFPLSAAAIVFIGKEILARFQSVALLKLALPLILSFAIIRLAAYLLRKVLAPSGALIAAERLIGIVVWLGVALHITGFLPDITAALDSYTFRLGKQTISLLSLLTSIFAIVITMLLALWLSRVLEERLMGSRNMDLNTRVLMSKFMRALLLLLGIFVALAMAGIDLTVLSVFGGALGVGLGFGLQKIASNYVSGFIILLDRSLHIGDFLTVDNHYGAVTRLTARYVVLRNLDGTEAIIPNETLITSTVLNHSSTERHTRLVLNAQIGYASDVDLARRIMLEAAEAHERVLREPAADVFIKGLGENGIDLELSLWISDPESGQNNLRSALYAEILRRFNAEDVEIPYPRRDLRVIDRVRIEAGANGSDTQE